MQGFLTLVTTYKDAIQLGLGLLGLSAIILSLTSLRNSIHQRAQSEYLSIVTQLEPVYDGISEYIDKEKSYKDAYPSIRRLFNLYEIAATSINHRRMDPLVAFSFRQQIVRDLEVLQDSPEFRQFVRDDWGVGKAYTEVMIVTLSSFGRLGSDRSRRLMDLLFKDDADRLGSKSIGGAIARRRMVARLRHSEL
jgi:hypothetical protein